MKPGDLVQYTYNFLASTDLKHSSSSGAKGVVLSMSQVAGLTLVKVQWSNEAEPMTVNASNLCKPGSRKSCAD